MKFGIFNNVQENFSHPLNINETMNLFLFEGTMLPTKGQDRVLRGHLGD